eukprot:gb/GECG01013605.1/.p1 GENE.gb/GECG01013605.1/~~gb/GECG01013605.1/.p1  ORF type:complete len:432 (+),score=52.21 gb/GECG01013605.1/:1-1296(+)
MDTKQKDAHVASPSPSLPQNQTLGKTRSETARKQKDADNAHVEQALAEDTSPSFHHQETPSKTQSTRQRKEADVAHVEQPSVKDAACPSSPQQREDLGGVRAEMTRQQEHVDATPVEQGSMTDASPSASFQPHQPRGGILPQVENGRPLASRHGVSNSEAGNDESILDNMPRSRIGDSSDGTTGSSHNGGAPAAADSAHVNSRDQSSSTRPTATISTPNMLNARRTNVTENTRTHAEPIWSTGPADRKLTKDADHSSYEVDTRHQDPSTTKLDKEESQEILGNGETKSNSKPDTVGDRKRNTAADGATPPSGEPTRTVEDVLGTLAEAANQSTFLASIQTMRTWLRANAYGIVFLCLFFAGELVIAGLIFAIPGIVIEYFEYTLSFLLGKVLVFLSLFSCLGVGFYWYKYSLTFWIGVLMLALIFVGLSKI